MAARINARVFKRLVRRLRASRSFVKVGVLSGRGGDQKHEDGDITMIELAAIHEFGSPAANIPERSFIRSTMRNKAPQMAAITEQVARKIVDDGMDVEDGLEALGQFAAAEVKKTITEGPHIAPPLKPETIARKKSDRPLVDTGRLLGSISHEVVRR